MTTHRALGIFLLAALIAAGGLFGCGNKGDGPKPPPSNSIIPLNGLRFKGTMGSDSLDKSPDFAVTDVDGNRLVGAQIQTSLLSGDGSGLPRSITTNASGIATLSYDFSGVKPFASVSLYVPDIDTVTAVMRADAIYPGVHGQVSYVSFDDDWSEVRAWLGNPVSVDHFPAPNNTIIYANYESTLGIVVMFYDLDGNGVLYDTSSVYGVIVNTVYPGTTTGANPIGIGSTFADLRARFGAPDYDTTVEIDTVEFGYIKWGLVGYAYAPPAGDSILTELHFSEYAVNPDHLVALHGLYYTGFVGSYITNPALEFEVQNTYGDALGGVYIDLTRVEGDGKFAGLGGTTYQMVTDLATGIANFRYTFNGVLGHALMRLTVPDVDTMDVYIRANTLIPGPGGQGQYILFDDNYSMVQTYNGTPASIDTTGLFGPDYIYANYANQLGVTFALYDTDHDRQAYDTSSIYGVIIDTAYTGTTLAGIGIGSSDSDVVAVYQQPDTTIAIPGDDLVRYRYDSLNLWFDINDSGSVKVVKRILMHE